MRAPVYIIFVPIVFILSTIRSYAPKAENAEESLEDVSDSIEEDLGNPAWNVEDHNTIMAADHTKRRRLVRTASKKSPPTWYGSHIASRIIKDNT